jgi:hypothetical protein
MCSNSCKKVPILFCEMLQRSGTFDMQQRNPLEKEATLILCKIIADIVDNHILSNDDIDNHHSFAKMYHSIIEKCACIDGFRACCLYKNIQEYLSAIKTENDNDKLKAEAEGKILDNILRIKEFIKQCEEIE